MTRLLASPGINIGYGPGLAELGVTLASLEDEIIERCARVADDHARRLQVSKGSVRTHRYDKSSVSEIDYGTRQVKRVAAQIRNTKTGKDLILAPPRDPNHERAVAILREVLPSIEKMRRSAWQANLVAEIKILIGHPGRVIS
jgi:hypothetical protein